MRTTPPTATAPPPPINDQGRTLSAGEVSLGTTVTGTGFTRPAAGAVAPSVACNSGTSTVTTCPAVETVAEPVQGSNPAASARISCAPGSTGSAAPQAAGAIGAPSRLTPRPGTACATRIVRCGSEGSRAA